MQPWRTQTTAGLAAGSLSFFSADFGTGGASPGGYAAGPFAQPPTPKPSRWWLWLLIILGGGGLLCAGCCGGFTWFGFSASTKILAQALKQEVADNADVKENLGEITSINMNIMESGREKQKRGGTSNWIAMDAEGTKGKGTFIVESSPAPQPGNFFSKIELRLPDGKTIPIK